MASVMAEIIDKYEIPYLETAEQGGEKREVNQHNFMAEQMNFEQNEEISNWGDELSRLGVSEIG